MNKILDLIFPRYVKCLICSKEIYDINSYSLCEKCLKKLDFIEGNSCIYCGRVLKKEKICLRCRKKRYYFSKGVSILEYTKDSKKLLFQFKNHRKTYFAYYFAEMLYDKLKINNMLEFDVITWVPSHYKKVLKRGFTPSYLISKYLSEFSNIPFKKILIKEREGKSMKELSKKERKNEILNSFKVKNVKENFKNILLVDDVFTTGATLNECSRILFNSYECDIIIATIYVGDNRIKEGENIWQN